MGVVAPAATICVGALPGFSAVQLGVTTCNRQGLTDDRVQWIDRVVRDTNDVAVIRGIDRGLQAGKVTTQGQTRPLGELPAEPLCLLPWRNQTRWPIRPPASSQRGGWSLLAWAQSRPNSPRSSYRGLTECSRRLFESVHEEKLGGDFQRAYVAPAVPVTVSVQRAINSPLIVLLAAQGGLCRMTGVD